MDLNPLCEFLDYQFRHPRHLEEALTHKSFVNENSALQPKDNERLEFLGDSVLSLLISQLLMERFPELNEGGLSKMRAKLVSESGLSRIALKMNLGQYLRIGRGEEISGGREKPSILSNALEALFGALYLDSLEQEGLIVLQRLSRKLFSEHLPSDLESFISHDYKTELQELLQKKYRNGAIYKFVRESGPDHQKEFEIAVFMQDQEIGRGCGPSKKQAEQAAAKKALTTLADMN